LLVAGQHPGVADDQARPALSRHRELMLQILGGESHDATVATGRYSEMTRL
jgi:hypothetical protein